MLHEISSNGPVGGKRHYQKAIERMKNIENILRKEKLTVKEVEVLNEIYDKLKKAVDKWNQKN